MFYIFDLSTVQFNPIVRTGPRQRSTQNTDHSLQPLLTQATLIFSQVFHVVYVVIKTANSPRPGTWILERSSDYGKTYSPWYYFAPSRNECWDLFKRDPRVPLVNDDDVLCVTKYSQIPPFENGEIFISLVNGRPSTEFKRYQFSKTLQVNPSSKVLRHRLIINC